MVAAAVLLVGAGPAGLAAADALVRAGLAFDWIDRHGDVGGAYRRMYPALELASPARYSALPGLPVDAAGEYVHAGDYARYLERFAARIGRAPRRADLTELARDGGSLRARANGAELGRYRAAVIATGMFDTPRPLEVPGLVPGPGLRVLHARDWRGPAELAGARLLVVGGGMTGVELAEEAAHAGIATTLAARRRVRTLGRRILGRELHDWAVLLERLPVPRWTKLCRGDARLPAADRGFHGLVRAGQIAVRPALVEMVGPRARFADGREQDFDVVVCATGYSHATPFLPAEVARHANGMPVLRRGRSVSWPELHFIGLPCAGGADSPYLRGMGADAARTARRLSRSDV
jgi:putative flavoprotein involved in K+ transport